VDVDPYLRLAGEGDRLRDWEDDDEKERERDRERDETEWEEEPEVDAIVPGGGRAGERAGGRLGGVGGRWEAEGARGRAG
jgi:hypothetical protein